MEKWMNVEGKHPSPRNHDNEEARYPARSPPASPIKVMHLPLDPRKWNAEHVGKWLEALEVKYALSVDKSNFKMNGRALALMKLEGFLSRVPGKGVIFYDDFRGRLRQYFMECRKRIRTTILPTGMLPPGKAPPTFGPQSELYQRQHMLSSVLQPPLNRAQSGPLGAVPGAVGSIPGVRAPASAHHNGPSHLPGGLQNHRMPYHAQPTPLPYGTHTLSWQPLSTGTAGMLPPAHLTGAAPHHLGYNSTSLMNRAVCLPYPGMYPLYHVPSVHEANSVANAANTTHQDPFRASLSAQMPPPVAFPPSQPNSVVASTEKSTISPSCPLHSTQPTTTAAAAAARVGGSDGMDPTSTFPHYGGMPPLPPSPYYKFVPLYRSMKIVGRYQAIPYGYRTPDPHEPKIPPTATHVAEPVRSSGAGSPKQATTSLNRTSSVPAAEESEQWQALDLSLARKSSGNASPVVSAAGGVAPDRSNERKRFKTEPKSP